MSIDLCLISHYMYTVDTPLKKYIDKSVDVHKHYNTKSRPVALSTNHLVSARTLVLDPISRALIGGQGPGNHIQ